MDSDTVAGFAAIHPQQWIAPLDYCSDGFIEIIEVTKEYQRQGIGSHLVKLLEEFAKSYDTIKYELGAVMIRLKHFICGTN